MPYLKLDTGILDSTLWLDRSAREVFITSLLMARPHELAEPTPQLEVRSLAETGFVVPPGEYGFVRAAGVGIIRRAGLDDTEAGLAALERLGAPEADSRSSEFEGRRLVRVDGGYVVLNFMRYRERDYTAAARAKRYREKQRHGGTSRRHGVTHRDVTEAVGRKHDVSSIEETQQRVGDKITASRARYTSEQLLDIDAAVADFARTRKGGKIADSVVAREYEYWEGFPPEQVAAGLRTYVEKRYALKRNGGGEATKTEKYARGIIRNTDPLDAALGDPPPAPPHARNGRAGTEPARDPYLPPSQVR